jgi:hypothetical protein
MPKPTHSANRSMDRGAETSSSSFPFSEALLRESLRHKFIYSMTGLVLGLLCMIGGVVMFLNGVAGSTNWTAKILGSESTITDAAPGAVLFVVGLFVVLVTRYKVTINQDTKGPDRSVFVSYRR